jgi:hypothetical protein
VIEAWFNERGYVATTEKGISKRIYDLSDAMVNNAAMLYICRWMVFNDVMNTIKELGETTLDRDLMLHTDSRLIEELQGELTPDNTYAQASLRWFIEEDYVSFRRVLFNKCAATTINGKLSESINQTRPASA